MLAMHPVIHGRGDWILFVDDDELLARLGPRMLSGLGYEVDSVKQPRLTLFAASSIHKIEPISGLQGNIR